MPTLARILKEDWRSNRRTGNRVAVGAGAKIIGDLEIGEDVVVGAQALVVRSVPAGARCHAPPAEIRPGSSAG